jgi:hypothetical protein
MGRLLAAFATLFDARSAVLRGAVQRTALPLCAVLCGSGTARADQFDYAAELRAVAVSSADTSRLYGGLGALGFDENHQGAQPGYLWFGYQADPLRLLHVELDAVSYADKASSPIDLTEAYAELRPLPFGSFRSRLKVGAFYPDISLENRMRGWRSPYTLSDSAINTWVGEELRTIGAEYRLDWLGQQRGKAFNLGVSVAGFGWNDPAGTVLATRGWGLHDRQSTLFGRYAYHSDGLGERTVFYDDIDKRAGYDAGLSLNYRGLLEVKLLRYDNRADPAIYSERIDDVAWHTHFDSLGVRWTPDDDWTVIAQRLFGRTYAGAPTPEPNCWIINSDFLLVSWTHGKQRISARYDQFGVGQNVSQYGSYGWDYGHAWTLALSRELSRHWSVELEDLQVNSRNNSRPSLGLPVWDLERQVQIAVRYEH